MLRAAGRSGHPGLLFGELLRRLWSTRRWYGYERSLSLPLEAPPPKRPVVIREWRPEDAAVLLNPADARTPAAAKDRLVRLAMLGAQVPTCYVAVTEDGQPCHMQWMIGADGNERVRACTRGGLPPVDEKTVLLENAFTHEAHRRQGIEKWIVKHLLESARQTGHRRAILFVSDNNALSRNMVERMGFSPFLLKTDRSRLFLRRFTFERLPDTE